VEAWLQPATGIASWSGAVVNSSTDARTDGWGLYYSGGNINFFVNNNATGAVSAAITLDRWTHVAATYDGSTIRLYLNGTQAASKTYNTPITYVPHSWRIGSGLDSASNTGFWWTGNIDDVALYNSALTATQIQLHCDSGRQ
jgi:hypothetical protein